MDIILKQKQMLFLQDPKEGLSLMQCRTRISFFRQFLREHIISTMRNSLCEKQLFPAPAEKQPYWFCTAIYRCTSASTGVKLCLGFTLPCQYN